MSFDTFAPHPLARGSGGAYGMKAGDIVQHKNGRKCRLDEALPDGDAFVTWEDGTYGETKWHHLHSLKDLSKELHND